jgi:hypothetical protein
MVSVQGGPEVALPILEYRVKQTGDRRSTEYKWAATTLDSLTSESCNTE